MPEEEWRVPRHMIMLKIAGLAVAVALAIFSLDDGRGLLLAGVAVAVFGALVLRDLLVPVRLAASSEGLTVASGFVRRIRLPWSSVERIRVDVRRRYGLRMQLLEIDVGETLYLLSAYDLGVPCQEAAARLRAYQTW